MFSLPLFTGNGDLLAEYYLGEGQVVARNMNGYHGLKEPGKPTLQTRGGLLYYSTDALGNISDLTGQNGEVSAQFRFDAFGGMYAGILAPYNHMGLTGKDYDAKTGLIDFGARWYDPFSGRFAQADTYKGQLGFPATQQAYAYTGNNPINNIDPTGHDWADDLDWSEWTGTDEEREDFEDVWNDYMDSQYGEYPGHSGGDDDGGGSGGGGYTPPPPPTPAEKQATFNAAMSAAKSTVYTATQQGTNTTKSFSELMAGIERHDKQQLTPEVIKSIQAPLTVEPKAPTVSQYQAYSRNQAQWIREQELAEKYKREAKGRDLFIITEWGGSLSAGYTYGLAAETLTQVNNPLNTKVFISKTEGIAAPYGGEVHQLDGTVELYNIDDYAGTYTQITASAYLTVENIHYTKEYGTIDATKMPDVQKVGGTSAYGISVTTGKSIGLEEILNNPAKAVELLPLVWEPDMGKLNGFQPGDFVY